MNLLHRLSQVLVLALVFILPWFFWSVTSSIVFTLPLLGVFLHSEFFEVFSSGGSNHWLISMKFFSPPKRIVKLDEEGDKKYWVDIVGNKSDKYVIIYGRFLFLWYPKYRKEEYIYNTSDIKKIEECVNSAISKYEKKVRSEIDKIENKRGYKSRLENWDGLVGSDREKKIYRREIRLDSLLKKDKSGSEEETEKEEH